MKKFLSFVIVAAVFVACDSQRKNEGAITGGSRSERIYSEEVFVDAIVRGVDAKGYITTLFWIDPESLSNWRDDQLAAGAKRELVFEQLPPLKSPLWKKAINPKIKAVGTEIKPLESDQDPSISQWHHSESRELKSDGIQFSVGMKLRFARQCKFRQLGTRSPELLPDTWSGWRFVEYYSKQLEKEAITGGAVALSWKQVQGEVHLNYAGHTFIERYEQAEGSVNEYYYQYALLSSGFGMKKDGDNHLRVIDDFKKLKLKELPRFSFFNKEETTVGFLFGRDGARNYSYQTLYLFDLKSKAYLELALYEKCLPQWLPSGQLVPHVATNRKIYWDNGWGPYNHNQVVAEVLTFNGETFLASDFETVKHLKSLYKKTQLSTTQWRSIRELGSASEHLPQLIDWLYYAVVTGRKNVAQDFLRSFVQEDFRSFCEGLLKEIESILAHKESIKGNSEK